MIQKTIIDCLCNLININTTIDSNNEIEGVLYIKEVFDNLGIENFNFTEGTSPHKVTEPIAAQGINTLLMETCITNSIQEKHDTAEKLIYTLDNLKK